ncbi:hypothetical protein [Psychromonas sp. KJ10-2]|uniref:hypothetical protein n=1 Tax=Psychromonas sp. KJ10-2 TaxID=3391822 RepID=UPI0039B5E6AF
MKLEVIKKLIVAKLEAESEAILQQWPTPQGTATHYFYIDNVLPVELADAIYAAFPKQGDGFHQRKSFREQKSTFAALADSAPILNDITKAFQLPEVIEKISELVGMKALQGDPTLYAGGLSMMFKGDFLNPHIDNSHDGNRQRLIFTRKSGHLPLVISLLIHILQVFYILSSNASAVDYKNSLNSL